MSLPAALGGLPPGSVPAMLGDSLRIWPLWPAFHLACPRFAGPGLIAVAVDAAGLRAGDVMWIIG